MPKVEPGKLTARQEAFCREYLIDMNGTQAAIRAGYSKASAAEIARQLLGGIRNPGIVERINELMAQKDAEVIASADEVLTFLTDMMRGKIHEQTVTRDGEVVDLPPKNADRNKAAELLGKRHALFTDKVSASVATGDFEIIIGGGDNE